MDDATAEGSAGAEVGCGNHRHCWLVAGCENACGRVLRSHPWPLVERTRVAARCTRRNKGLQVVLIRRTIEKRFQKKYEWRGLGLTMVVGEQGECGLCEFATPQFQVPLSNSAKWKHRFATSETFADTV